LIGRDKTDYPQADGMPLVPDRGRGILPAASSHPTLGVIVEDHAMDHQTIDRLARLFATAASRRTTWRAMLGAALFGVTTRSAVAQRCPDSKHLCGGERGECCPGTCFRDEFNPSCEACCTEKNNNIICNTTRGPVCCHINEAKVDPCTVVEETGECPVSPEGVGETCVAGISGSYRRR
jgi:hypothetical protein